MNSKFVLSIPFVYLDDLISMLNKNRYILVLFYIKITLTVKKFLHKVHTSAIKLSLVIPRSKLMLLKSLFGLDSGNISHCVSISQNSFFARRNLNPCAEIINNYEWNHSFPFFIERSLFVVLPIKLYFRVTDESFLDKTCVERTKLKSWNLWWDYSQSLGRWSRFLLDGITSPGWQEL